MGDNGLPVSLGIIIAAAVLGACVFVGTVVASAIDMIATLEAAG